MYESYNKRKIGRAWEKTAQEYLRRKGYSVLMMNYRTRYSEIDIIAETRGFLVFIEVKYRRTAAGTDQPNQIIMAPIMTPMMMFC